MPIFVGALVTTLEFIAFTSSALFRESDSLVSTFLDLFVTLKTTVHFHLVFQVLTTVDDIPYHTFSLPQLEIGKSVISSDFSAFKRATTFWEAYMSAIWDSRSARLCSAMSDESTLRAALEQDDYSHRHLCRNKFLKIQVRYIVFSNCFKFIAVDKSSVLRGTNHISISGNLHSRLVPPSRLLMKSSTFLLIRYWIQHQTKLRKLVVTVIWCAR